ncbi:MAG: hypothetical protein L6Q76_25420, partial [Polyangiaceae bacterium]|nr:hypothetical protein [Polyangiaceae bacterium]
VTDSYHSSSEWGNNPLKMQYVMWLLLPFLDSNARALNRARGIRGRQGIVWHGPQGPPQSMSISSAFVGSAR